MAGGRSATQKVAIVTDSIACLTKEIVAQYGIRIVPLNFYSEGKVYKDWVDITPAEAYELFLKDPESFWSVSLWPPSKVLWLNLTGPHSNVRHWAWIC